MLKTTLDFEINELYEKLTNLNEQLSEAISEKKRSVKNLTDYARKIGYTNQVENDIRIAEEKLQYLSEAQLLINKANSIV